MEGPSGTGATSSRPTSPSGAWSAPTVPTPPALDGNHLCRASRSGYQRPETSNMTTSGLRADARWPLPRGLIVVLSMTGLLVSVLGAEAVCRHHRTGPPRAHPRHQLPPTDRDPARSRCAAVAGGHDHAARLDHSDPRHGHLAGAVGRPPRDDPAQLPGPVRAAGQRVASLAGLPRGGSGPGQRGHPHLPARLDDIRAYCAAIDTGFVSAQWAQFWPYR